MAIVIEAALAFLGFGDPVASFVGSRWGKYRLANDKSLIGCLSFFTVSLLTIGFYLGWTDGDSVTLLGAALFVPYVFLAPLVVGTYLIRDAPDSAW